jgi:glyoxylase-like metal-dependent hydrolase (beta-lactamase superfamily II)
LIEINFIIFSDIMFIDIMKLTHQDERAIQAQIESFYEPITGTVTHVAFDRLGGHAAVIDPVLDYDPKSGRTRTASADQVLAYLQANALSLAWILETHAHADHFVGGTLPEAAGGWAYRYRCAYPRGTAGIQTVVQSGGWLPAGWLTV